VHSQSVSAVFQNNVLNILTRVGEQQQTLIHFYDKVNFTPNLGNAKRLLRRLKLRKDAAKTPTN